MSDMTTATTVGVGGRIALPLEIHLPLSTLATISATIDVSISIITWTTIDENAA